MSPLNITRAFFLGLLRQRTHQVLANEKGLHLVELREENDNFPLVRSLPLLTYFFYTLSHFLTALLHTTISLLYLLYVVFFASVHFHYQSVQVIYITVTLAS